MAKIYSIYTYLVIFWVLTLVPWNQALSQEQYIENEIQAPTPIIIDDSFKAIYPHQDKIVTVPANCQNRSLHLRKPCQANSKLELALEREYWRHISLVDSNAMNQWLQKTRNYVKFSQTKNAGRMAMLRIFANLHVYSESPLVIDPLRSPYVIGALASASRARRLMPRSPNAQAFYWAIQNFTQFALGQQTLGERSAQKMIDLGDQYREWGAAGPIGAVAHLMGANDPELVRRGIDYYDECYAQGVCQRETSVAPFQYIGTLITQAEAYGYLGDFDKMHQTLDKIDHLSLERNWPLAAEVKKIREDLVRSGGLIDQWLLGKSTGSIRTPRGASHSRRACAYCHVGNFVPDHYYP